jgi:hypothetical protein
VCAILVASHSVLGIRRSGRASLHPLEPNVPVPVPISIRVHGWRVADAVPVSVRRASCAIRGTIVPLLVKLRRLVVLGMHTR